MEIKNNNFLTGFFGKILYTKTTKAKQNQKEKKEGKRFFLPLQDVPRRGFEPGTLTTTGECALHWAKDPTSIPKGFNNI